MPGCCIYNFVLILLSTCFAVASSTTPLTVTFPFTNMYESVQSERLDFNILVLKLIWLFFFVYISHVSSFLFCHVFVLSWDDCLVVLMRKHLIFWYSILSPYIYNYNDMSSSIICCHSDNVSSVSSSVIDPLVSSRVLFETAFVFRFCQFTCILADKVWRSFCNTLCNFVSNLIASCFYRFFGRSF